MRLTNNQKLLLYVAAGVCFIVIVDRFFISDFRSRLNTLGQQVRLEEARLKRNLTIQKTKDTITKDYEYCKPFLELTSVDENEIIAGLLKEIENLARLSGATVINLSPYETKEEAQQYRKYRATLRLEANLQQLLNFLYNVQNSELLIKLDRMAVATKGEEVHVLRIDGIITIAVPL